jgi:uncharacterized protein
MNESRRQFLKHTLATTAACGLASVSAADHTSTADTFIDTHVYLGRWPHQRLPSEQPGELISTLRHHNVSQAWVGSFDGLFHKDVAAANQRLADTIQSVASKSQPIRLLPFGAVNPTLPDWEDDVRRCRDKFEMRGVRLHPNYHGYTLDDSRFSRLLEICAADGLTVQIVCWMEDEQHFLLSPKLTRVDLKPLADRVAALPKLKLVVTNGYRSSDDNEIRSLLPLKSIYFDFARAEQPKDIRLLIKKTSSDRVVLGSGTPLRTIEPVIAKMRQAELTDDSRKAVAMKNAHRLVATDSIP